MLLLGFRIMKEDHLVFIDRAFAQRGKPASELDQAVTE